MFPLPETITVWRRTGSDGLGGGAWATPAQYPARVAYSQQKYTDINGDTAVSTAVAYTEGPVDLDDIRAGVHVLFGVSDAIAPPPNANDIRGISHTPSGAGDLRKLWFS